MLLSPLVAVTGCTGADTRKQDIGRYLGSALGAVAGYKYGNSSSAVALGALAGTWLGGEIGRHLDEKDRQAVAAAAQKALTPGTTQAVTWRNPDSGNSGELLPLGTDKARGGCQLIHHEASVGGTKMAETERWCLGGNDAWEYQETLG